MTEDNSSKTQQQEYSLINKYCPICGDTMHERTIMNRVYWECDDPDCGYLEVKP